MPKPPLAIVGSDANNIPTPPRPLGVHGRALWNRVLAQYDISDAGGIELLTLACQALDRAEACAEEIGRTGQMLQTRHGLKANPLSRDELANRAFMTRTLDRLGVNHEVLQRPGRPSKPIGWTGE